MLHSKLCSLVKMNNKTKQFHKECKYDLGGYFIINGSEKVIVSRRTAENKIYVFKTNKNSTKYSQICEIKSIDLKSFGLQRVFKLNYQQKMILKIMVKL